MQPSLIGLTGLAGSGKDTVAALLRMREYRRYAFGDAVRKEVYDCIMGYLNYTFEELPPEWGENSHFGVGAGYLTLTGVWKKPTSDWMRQILQRHGSEFRRAQDPDYWVKQFCEHYDLFRLGLGNDARMVVTDVRFLNEAETIRNLGGVIWRVTRPDTEAMNHISETEQSQIEVDATIVNDRSMMDLAEKVRLLL